MLDLRFAAVWFWRSTSLLGRCADLMCLLAASICIYSTDRALDEHGQQSFGRIVLVCSGAFALLLPIVLDLPFSAVCSSPSRFAGYDHGPVGC